MFLTQINPPVEQWDEFVANHERGHFLQTSAWGNVKSDFGWQAQRVALTDTDKNIIAGAQILYRELPYGLGKLAYVPFGPVVDWADKGVVRDLLTKMDKAAKRKGAVFMKLEPGYDVDTEFLKKLRCHVSPQTVQPPRTIMLDIHRRDAEGKIIPPDFILQGMNQMTRRNIRKSEKFDIQVREGSRADVDQFNALLDRTSSRQDFGVHVPEYYEKVYDEIIAPENKPPRGALFIGSWTDEETGERKDLAGSFIFVVGKWAWYVYGASSREESKRMAPFAVQWHAIQWARDRGAQHYDLYGIPDYDKEILEEQFKERNDGMWTLYRTKRGWGGDVLRTVGAWDRIYNPMVYWIYRIYLFLRARKDEDSETD